MDILTKTELKEAIKEGLAISYINAYYNRKGIIKPKDIKPKWIKVAEG